LKQAEDRKLVDRNELCPCGSGKKFKKCHLGREDELKDLQEERARIRLRELLLSLQEVTYGRSQEIKASLDLQRLVNVSKELRFVDLNQYIQGSSELPFYGDDGLHKSGGLVINPWKTAMVDPKYVYVAISDDITDSALIHEVAHVLDYLGGARLMPWIAHQLSTQLDVPLEHLEHLQEFGYWLDWLKERYQVSLDADDTIIQYLFKQGLLIKAGDVILGDHEAIKAQSKRILEHLSLHSREIEKMIRERKGYRGIKHGDL
jgi:hypothetical protein